MTRRSFVAGSTLAAFGASRALGADDRLYVDNCNGLKIHAFAAGDPGNPLVLLLHGMPETAYCWKDYLKPIAEAGYYVVAPDMRGYGYTTPVPEATKTGENYATSHLVADMVALVYRLGYESCSIVGHDWGAAVAMSCAARRPDLFTSVCLMSVPYVMAGLSNGPVGTAGFELAAPPGHVHYQQWFSDRATFEAADEDPEAFLLSAYMAWGLPGAEHLEPPAPVFLPATTLERHGIRAWSALFPEDVPIRRETLAPGISNEYLDYTVKAFQHSGFAGPLQYYTAILYINSGSEDSQFAGRKLEQPVLFIAGENDPCIGPMMFKGPFDEMERTCPGLTRKVLLNGGSHWVQHEQPKECLRLILEFEAEVH